ncbi:MAG: VWA domain-containing protein [Deltaproteobacteria bacterium]|nr:VWA domain-containing protein [Deltaproteobacteria bacterium]
MTLQNPWWLLLALFVPLALWLRWRRGGPTVLFAPGAFLARLPVGWRVRLLPLPWLLLVAGLLLTVVALARPVQDVPLPHETEGIDIMLCLDTSSSMTSSDMDPQRTRLDVARDAAARFVAGRPNDRIGLVCFARFPDLRCPPTPDHDALRNFLAAVAPVAGDGPEDATGIGTAVARAAQVLRSSPAKSRVVILLTDGEENIATAEKPEEIAPVHAGQLCRELGVKVYAIAAGLGSRNPSGDWVEIDTSQVRRLAATAGGRFFEARDAGAVAGVYAEIDELERVAFREPRTTVEEKFLPFLAAAVVLLLASRILQSTLLAVMP